LAGVTILAQGCIRDDFATCPTAGDGTVLLQIRMPEMAKTRATQTSIPAKTNEYDIDHLDVLVFADKGGANDTFLYATTPTSEVADSGNPATRIFVLPIRKSDSGVKQRLVLIANLETEVAALIEQYLSGEDSTTVEKTEALSLLTFAHKDWHGGGLPMWGESTGAIITPSSTGSAFGNIDMLFSVARIEAAVNGNSDLSKAGTLDNFRFKQFQIKNRLKFGYAAPQDGSGYANGKVTSPSVPSSNEKTTLTESPYTVGSGVSYYSAIGYAQEINNSELSNDEGLYVLIGGQYVEPGETVEDSTPVTWYRVDLYDRSAADPQTAKLDILRGHRYMINITGVTGSGYDTPEEAAESYTSKMNAEVTVWNGNNLEVDPAGQYKLNISESEWNFNGLARTDADTNNKVTISTDYKDGWVASIKDTAGNDINWLTLSQASGDADEVSEVSINVLAYNSQIPRRGHITVEAGKWSYVINVSQQLASLTISPAEMILDFDYYPLPLERNELTIDTEAGWMFDRIEYTTTATVDWLGVIDPVVANPLEIFDATKTNLPADEVRTSDEAYLRVSANPEASVRTATVYFKTEDGATAHVDVRQGWIEAGVGGVPKEMEIGGNTYRTHIYGANVKRIGMAMQKMGYFDSLVAATGNAYLKIEALAYLNPLRDVNTYSCFMIDNSREGNYYMEHFNDNPAQPIGPYYWTDRTIEGVRYTSASACPDGWRLPTAEDINNMLIGSDAMNYYGLTHYAPDYALWAGDENFVGAMRQGNVYPSTTTVSLNTTSPGGTSAYWHSDWIYENSPTYRVERALYVSRGSSYENSPAGVDVEYSQRDEYYDYPDDPASSYVNMHLLPVRCGWGKDMMHFPMHNE
jgi:hypothetical protein